MLVDVDVWSGDLYAGCLPQICVFTGQPTAGVHSVRYSAVPRWVIALLFAGILPYLIALQLTRRTVVGTLPMSPQALRRFVVQRAVTLILVVAIPVLCFVLASILGATGHGDGAAVPIAAGFAFIVGGALISLIWSGAIGIAGQVEDRPGWGRWVRLRGVNPTFAAAVRHLYASRMPQWQVGTVPTSLAGVRLPDGYAPAPGPPGWSPVESLAMEGWPAAR